jgi:hypothetical protein
MSVSASSAASARVFMISKWWWTTPMCDYCDGYIGFCARFPKYRRQIDGRVHGSQPRLRDRGNFLNRASSVQVPPVVADGQKLDRLGPADRTPPAWKPKARFTSNKREVYGRLIRCRTGQAFIGDYYASSYLGMSVRDTFPNENTSYRNARDTRNTDSRRRTRTSYPKHQGGQ